MDIEKYFYSYISLYNIKIIYYKFESNLSLMLELKIVYFIIMPNICSYFLSLYIFQYSHNGNSDIFYKATIIYERNSGVLRDVWYVYQV